MKRERYVVIILASAIFSVGCSHYSGTRKMDEKTSLGYAAAIPRPVSRLKPDGRKMMPSGLTPESAGVYIIGLIFAEADKAITKARTGDYKAVGRPLAGTGVFPESGYLVLARTISDPENKYPEIAGANDLIHARAGTAAAQLAKEISSNARITPGSLGKTLAESLGSDLDDNVKISMLTLCEVVPLDGGYEGLYGVTFSGMYYPLLAGTRFAGESSDPITRITKSKEAMVLEIYGPNGSGFTTGIVKVPMAWTPPQERGEHAPWVTGKMLLEAYARTDNETQIGELKDLLDNKADGRLARRQAFVVPEEIKQKTLRGDYVVSETSEATGWILKAVGKAKDAAEGVVSGD